MEFMKIYISKVSNARKTLDRKILVAPIYNQIKLRETQEAFSALRVHKELNFWDFGVRATPQISIGDTVRIVAGTTCYLGQVVGKLNDPSGEIGDLFGWSRQFNAPWKNICALDIHSTKDIDSKEISYLINSSEKMVDSFYSFRPTHHSIKQEALLEGRIVELTLTAYERNPEARKACLEHFGLKCEPCGFDFGAIYGELGKGFIHVHHKTPLSQVRETHFVDPIKDLVPVCPNCHAFTPTYRGKNKRLKMSIGSVRS